MRRTKSLLKKSAAETAQRRRTCDHTGDAIQAGCSCLVIFDTPRQRFCYSRLIALRMIEDARQKLRELEQALG